VASQGERAASSSVLCRRLHQLRTLGRMHTGAVAATVHSPHALRSGSGGPFPSPEVVFGYPSVVVLSAFVERIVPLLEVVRLMSESELAKLSLTCAITSVVGGLYADACGGCTCSATDGRCDVCTGQARFGRKFFVQRTFTEYYPFSRGHWFCGVTDAVDTVGWLPGLAGVWLQCRCVRGTDVGTGRGCVCVRRTDVECNKIES
jgi:hypothetical protein